jgi:sec-independent protein translocase protein TatA
MADGLMMPSHLIILALVALLLFGPKRLPEIGRSLGSSIREFRGGLSEGASADHALAPSSDDADESSIV